MFVTFTEMSVVRPKYSGEERAGVDMLIDADWFSGWLLPIKMRKRNGISAFMGRSSKWSSM